ncbi:uncharacterized protein EI90DRAFT_3294996, partial [Cantharellus anzutake]
MMMFFSILVPPLVPLLLLLKGSEKLRGDESKPGVTAIVRRFEQIIYSIFTNISHGNLPEGSGVHGRQWGTDE